MLVHFEVPVPLNQSQEITPPCCASVTKAGTREFAGTAAELGRRAHRELQATAFIC
jgi:hypothetical protein